MSSANDFIIENGVLKKYTGPGGDVVIPEGMKKLSEAELNRLIGRGQALK